MANMIGQILADLSAAQVEDVKEEKYMCAELEFSTWIEDSKNLPRHILEEFKKTGFVARVLKYVDRYEIRYCRNGYNICASHSDLRRAKELFLDEARKTEERRRQDD